MIVTGSEMTVTSKFTALSAHNKGYFGMGLQMDKSKHDLNTRPFHIAGPTNIRLFIKSGFELDQSGY